MAVVVPIENKIFKNIHMLLDKMDGILNNMERDVEELEEQENRDFTQIQD